MKNIPNILSAFRIVLIPFFVWQMLQGNTLYAGLILVGSGFTDLLDGFLARRFGWISNLGKVLDPVADKLTQAAVSFTLMLLLRHYWYFFAFMIAKDFVMLVLGGYLLVKGVTLDGAQWFGKLSTAVYYGATILIVLFPALPQWTVITLLSLASLCALIAALLYVPEFLRYKREEAQQNPGPEPQKSTTI